jgi:hypothetical protein
MTKIEGVYTAGDCTCSNDNWKRYDDDDIGIKDPSMKLKLKDAEN